MVTNPTSICEVTNRDRDQSEEGFDRVVVMLLLPLLVGFDNFEEEIFTNYSMLVRPDLAADLVGHFPLPKIVRGLTTGLTRELESINL
jgi:hypothetical protein